jgi:regulatory protein
MRITDISLQTHNPNRVNVSIDGKFRFSLAIAQVTDLGVKKGSEIDESELEIIEAESQFGKLYARTLEYCLMRPHSIREVREYLWRKTRTTNYKTRSGEIKQREGVAQAIADRVLAHLQEKGYVDDVKFTRWWVESRNLTKGSSLRKLTAELRAKGVAVSTIEEVLKASERTDEDELAKMIAKKRAKYADDQKLIQYLARQGFDYDTIKQSLRTLD